MAYRFDSWLIDEVTVENHAEILPVSLCLQIEMFLPPSGSFSDLDLRRYLENLKDYEKEDPTYSMTLANRLRVAFQSMEPDTICGKFPTADLPLKRRLRCVAEYLIRAGEFDKMRDENGKLIKKRGVLGKLVVIYQPLDKMRETLIRQGFLKKNE
jgi:hypothetical protein